MSEGFSFESFGAIARVCEDTLYEWAKVHPEFSEAKKMAYVMNRYKWEENGIASDMNPTIWIFNMKNRFPKQWRDRQEVVQETTHKADVNNVNELAEKLAEVMKLAEEND